MEPYINITEERSKQLLSLDALDLYLLPTSYQPWLQDNSDFLWRNNAFLPDRKYYYEFVIKSKSERDGTTNETTHIMCYICNTAVPKAYVNEHVKSSKHIAYQKIAETGLQRALKHKQLSGTDDSKSSLNYFCEHCAAVIFTSNRNEHEKSKTHKNFAALDAFLNNFALFYTNNETGDIIESLISEDSNDMALLKINANDEAKIEQNVDFDITSFKPNGKDDSSALEKTTSDMGNKLKDSKILIHAIETRLDNTHKELNNNVTCDNYTKADVVDNLEQYIKHLKAYGAIKLHTIGSLDQDRIKIETSNGYEVIVSTFNFHGFKKMGRYLQCKLCEGVVKNVNTHRLHEKHLKIVARPFEDQHCIRHIYGRFSHCVICNEIINNRVVHTKYNNHVKKLEQALVPIGSPENENLYNINANNAVALNTEGDKSEPPKSLNTTEELKENINLNKYPIRCLSDTQYCCIVCDVQMHYNNVFLHLNGTKHKSNTKSSIYYLMNRDKNQNLTCKVCDTSVNFYTWAVEDHIASVNHIENYNKCLAINKVDKTDANFFCKPCEKQLFVMEEMSHIENLSHQIKLASYNINLVERNSHVQDITDKQLEVGERSNFDSKKLSTDSCDDKDILDRSDEVTNSNTDKHDVKPNKEDTNSENKINPVDSATYACDSCNEEIPNNSSNIKVHNESAKHKTMDELLSGVNNLLEELLKYFNSPTEIHSHLKVTDVENMLDCIVCTDKVTIEDTEKHTNSLKHIHKHRNLMDANKLKFKKDKYVCYACNVYVENGKEIRHINTTEHEKRMESLKNGDYVLITVENKTLIDKIHHILKTESESEEKPAKVTFGDFIPNKIDVTNVRHHFIELIDNKKQLICLLCQILVGNTEYQYRLHTSEVKHDMKYKTVMDYNQIFQIEEGFVCGFCECIITDEFMHLSEEKHVTSQKNYPNKNYCFTCKVSSIDVGLRKHLTSESHIKNIGNPSHFYCNICNLQISNSNTNVQRHNESFDHQNNLALIDENKVILKNKKCVCQVCEATFSRDGFEDHVESLNHIMLLHNYYHQPSLDYCSNQN